MLPKPPPLRRAPAARSAAAFLLATTCAASAAEVSPRPVSATQAGLTVSVVFPRESTARLIVQDGTMRHESREFEFPYQANHGAASVDRIEIKSLQTFAVHIHTRQTCGPGIYAFKFAYRGGEWLVSGLDRKEHQCSDKGPVPQWSASTNFLTGQIEYVDFAGGRGQARVGRKKFPRFTLIDFDPFNPRYWP